MVSLDGLRTWEDGPLPCHSASARPARRRSSHLFFSQVRGVIHLGFCIVSSPKHWVVTTHERNIKHCTARRDEAWNRPSVRSTATCANRASCENGVGAVAVFLSISFRSVVCSVFACGQFLVKCTLQSVVTFQSAVNPLATCKQ